MPEDTSIEFAPDPSIERRLTWLLVVPCRNTVAFADTFNASFVPLRAKFPRLVLSPTFVAPVSLSVLAAAPAVETLDTVRFAGEADDPPFTRVRVAGVPAVPSTSDGTVRFEPATTESWPAVPVAVIFFPEATVPVTPLASISSTPLKATSSLKVIAPASIVRVPPRVEAPVTVKPFVPCFVSVPADGIESVPTEFEPVPLEVKVVVPEETVRPVADIEPVLLLFHVRLFVLVAATEVAVIFPEPEFVQVEVTPPRLNAPTVTPPELELVRLAAVPEADIVPAMERRSALLLMILVVAVLEFATFPEMFRIPEEFVSVKVPAVCVTDGIV